MLASPRRLPARGVLNALERLELIENSITSQEDFAEKEFTHAIAEIVAKQQGATVDQMQVGRLVL